MTAIFSWYFLLLLLLLLVFVSGTISLGQIKTGWYCESASVLPGIHNSVCIAECCEGKVSKFRDYALLKLIKQFLQFEEL